MDELAHVRPVDGIWRASNLRGPALIGSESRRWFISSGAPGEIPSLTMLLFAGISILISRMVTLIHPRSFQVKQILRCGPRAPSSLFALICNRLELPVLAGIQSGRESGLTATVDEFITAKASNFNYIQQLSTSGPRLLQQELFGINKNSKISTRAGVWFRIKRSVPAAGRVQIHLSRPFSKVQIEVLWRRPSRRRKSLRARRQRLAKSYQ
jgi:hypothetical protein